MATLARAFAALLIAATAFLIPAYAVAGTTGVLIGRVTDAASGKPVSGARVRAASPAQSASVNTDANGGFRFLSLVPDTYVVTVDAPGYESTTYGGVTILADQTQQIAVTTAPRLQVIGTARARSASSLVKPGTTSDVYSVSGANADATAALGGPGGLASAYGQIASVPGAVVQQGQQGWYQTVNIRGGDIDQVGYELDGIPVNRPYDNAPQTVLSALGQQELQVYTGGIPASADASSISGYVNQVIKSGTYPGFGNLQLAMGSPALYNKGLVEVGGATPDRRFTYYVGLAGVDQAYRYVDNANGAGDPRLFYPVNVPTGAGNYFPAIYDGTATASNPLLLGPGQTYAIAGTQDREAVANLHFSLPHRYDANKDDLQLLYLNSRIVAQFYSSINDQGGPAFLAPAGIGNNGNATWNDGLIYTGPLGAVPNPAFIQPYVFHGLNRAALTNDSRDQTDNGVALEKLQWQRNIDDRSYFRLYGYAMYSNWFISGVANQDFTGFGSNAGINGFGGELNDYELPAHTYGFNAQYSRQLSDKNLLTATASTQQSAIERRFTYAYPGNYNGRDFATVVPTGAPFSGTCLDPTTGAATTCFSQQLSIGSAATSGIPAAPGGGEWIVTDPAYNGRLNRVSPIFSSISLTDQWHPNDKLNVNAGIRYEHYDDRLGTVETDPVRQFWINAYNNEYCYKPGFPMPVNLFQLTGSTTAGNGCSTLNATVPYGLPGATWRAANLALTSGGFLGATEWEPRLGATYAFNRDAVLRASWGVYARAVNTSWLQYDVVEPNLASYLGPNFLGLGYNTPVHDLRPDVSYNADLSYEQHLRGSDVSFTLTPYLRKTRDQLQPFPLGPGGVVTGANVGRQTSYGVEFAIHGGDAARNGLSWQLSYTYNNSKIRYSNFPGGTNVIDTLNAYIQEYNSYTKGCATLTVANALACGGQTANAQPTFVSGTTTITNPYYNSPTQPLLDRNAGYTTYDQIPTPFYNGVGYETPNVFSAFVSYKKGRFTITPSATYSSGSFYGNPLSVGGYVPTGCTANAPTASDPTRALPSTCTGTAATTGAPYLIIPDPFTGHFDTLGAFRQPSRLTVNLSTSYDVSKRVRAVVTLTGLVDRCYQRGYAWDDKNICVYSNLPGFGGLAPSGQGYPGAFLLPEAQLTAAEQLLKYPYGVFSNNLNTGFLGTKLPLQASFELRVRL